MNRRRVPTLKLRAVAVLLLALFAGLALAAPRTAAPRGPAPVEGTDYVLIADGAPYAPVAGRVEVAEVFSYTCGACAAFEPQLHAWAARLPATARLVRVPVPWQQAYARAYLAGEALGVTARAHPAVFRALHDDRALPRNASVDELATFYARHGASAERFRAAYASEGTTAQLDRAAKFIERSGVEGTPTLMINGRYRVRGSSFEDTLRIADHLIARERAAR